MHAIYESAEQESVVSTNLARRPVTKNLDKTYKYRLFIPVTNVGGSALTVLLSGIALLTASTEKLISYLGRASLDLNVSLFALAIVFTGPESDDTILALVLSAAVTWRVPRSEQHLGQGWQSLVSRSWELGCPHSCYENRLMTS